MSLQSRLALALDNGVVVLPSAGCIALYRPPIEMDLSFLPKNRVEIVESFKPHFDHWKTAGFKVGPSLNGEIAAAVVFASRAKALTRAMIADASARSGSGVVIIDGHKNDGVESLIKAVKSRGVPLPPAFSKFHGKLTQVSGHDFSDWAASETKLEDGFVTQPGVFSADAVDAGSRLLAQYLPDDLDGKIADLGAGWGYLSRQILTRSAVTECRLIEAEHVALELAKRNVVDSRAQFHWADVTKDALPTNCDHIVTNPPFHVSRKATPELGQAFISAASRMLHPGGKLWLVANRQLPYEAELRLAFAKVAELTTQDGFKVFMASRPVKRK